MERIVLQKQDSRQLSREKTSPRKHSIQQNGTKTTIVEISPTTHSDKTPLLHIAGWGGMGYGSYTTFSEQMAEKGYTSIFIETLSKRRGYTKDGISHIHVARARAMLDVLKQQDISEINIIAHSEGAIVGPLVALQSLHSSVKVKNIILVSPTGLMGKESPIPFTIRFLKHALEISRSDKGYTKTLEGRDTIRRNTKRTIGHPIVSIREIAAIAKSDTADIIQKIHALGIGVAVIHGDRDHAFPLSRVEDKSRKAGADALYIVPGAMHNAISSDPHFADYVERALTDLDERKFSEQ